MPWRSQHADEPASDPAQSIEVELGLELEGNRVHDQPATAQARKLAALKARALVCRPRRLGGRPQDGVAGPLEGGEHIEIGAAETLRDGAVDERYVELAL